MQASYGYEFKENDPYALIRRKQIDQVSSFIAKIALDDDHPILVMGDFNVNAIRHPEEGGDSREYLDMLTTLSNNGLFSVIDIHKDFNQGKHPVTNAGKGVKGLGVSKGGQRLDFVFEMRRNRTKRDRIFHEFPHCSVEHFQVEGEVYTHISDHFAAHVVMAVGRGGGIEERSDNKKDGKRKETRPRSGSNLMTVQLAVEL